MKSNAHETTRWMGWTCLTLLIYTVVFHWILPVGIIGEVEPMWGPIPQTTLSTPVSCFGELCLFPTRPILRWHEFPLMLNVYTSAFPDWIHWILYQMTHSIQVIRATQITCATVATMTLTYWLRNHLSHPILWMFWFLLMTDWNYLFYKKALGNTEILLQISWILCVLPLLLNWPIKSQRNHLVLGVILGLWIKITFILHLLPLTIAILWRNGHRIPLLKSLAVGALVGLLPGICFIWWTETLDISIRSHDFWVMQWDRIQHALSGQSSNVREQSSNVWLWLLDPLPFFSRAYGVESIIFHGWGRLGGYLLTVFILIRSSAPHITRWLSVLGSQILILTVIAQDLHHLVIATPLLWLCVAHIWNHARHQTLYKIAFGGILLSNVWILLDTPDRINRVSTPTFSESRQMELLTVLQKHNVTDLITMDYEVFGVLEVLEPSIDVTHAWPSISTERWSVLPRILDEHPSKHLIVLQSSMPMIYNLQPTQTRLETTAKQYGHHIQLIDSIENVELYKIIN